MDAKDFRKLKTELRKKAFPPRPRPMQHCGYHDGDKVYLRKTNLSTFQMYAKEKKPWIAIIPPPRRKGTQYASRMNCLLIQKLWDYICDKLFS